MTADACDAAAIHALPAGTRFGELEILGTLGVGGFGIVYLARDHALEREVAIKEYMPSQFASRDGRSQVSVRSVSMKETFELGRRSFVNEARLLARFDHPSLLKVYRFWEANGTAYMAMPRLVGQNLREARKARPTPPPEAWLRRIFDAVLGGLETLHAQHVWHRDVAPDNIFLPADGGPPVLLDFGAARMAIGDRTQVFTAILKPSFAPIEQYAEAATLRQGPWTDFYSLAAAMHELLTGRPPPPATARAMGDELAPLAVAGYSPRLLAGLDWALRVPPHQRPQSVAAWREVLDGHAGVPAAQPAPPRAARAPAPAPEHAASLDLEFADTVQGLPSQLDATDAMPLAAAAPAPRRRARQGLAVAGGGGAALLLLGLFVMQLRGGRPEAAPAEPAASAVVSVAQPRPAASAPASAPASTPVSTPAKPARRDAATRPVITEKMGDYRPIPRSADPVSSEPAASAAPASTGEPKTASEACGGRVLLARAWCIDRQCEKPAYQNDPDCVKLREIRSSRNGSLP
ncbi:serine/threonine-protein kinase [Roseateles sp.]|uniref:serine/threonine protein kinase n=1 Tax=Roseateles sp. TaxID=1971397 RepID=UPI0025DFF2C3|nr:serine/threonine-protein kinase [Roseateles sp.]MBV8035335.1 serine/threonine protein kinase [Roseateles sp.]